MTLIREMMALKKNAAVLDVLLAGTLWGTMGIFVRKLNAAGLNAFEVVQLRITLALVLIGAYLLLFDRQKLKLRLRDIWCFIGTGVISLLLFSWCYFSGIQIASLGVMAVLLYTAPVFVMLMSVALFREKLTASKLTALVMTFAGCCLVSGLGTDTQLSAQGLLLGIGSGLFYALYSVFSRYAIERGYCSWTITFYTFLFCSVGCAFLSDWHAIGACLAQPSELWPWTVGLALITGFLPYLFYTKGLEGMEPSRASILASVEPVVASVIGIIGFREPLTVENMLGVVLVVGGIAVLSLPKKRSAEG